MAFSQILKIKIWDIHIVERKNSIGIGVFGYENKEKHPIYVSEKCCEEKHWFIINGNLGLGAGV